MIGYTLDFQTDAAEAFSSISSQISVVKNNSGQVYWPQFTFNGIGNLLPGQGYQIRMTNDFPGFYFE